VGLNASVCSFGIYIGWGQSDIGGGCDVVVFVVRRVTDRRVHLGRVQTSILLRNVRAEAIDLMKSNRGCNRKIMGLEGEVFVD
jgi:hypothetical protein